MQVFVTRCILILLAGVSSTPAQPSYTAHVLLPASVQRVSVATTTQRTAAHLVNNHNTENQPSRLLQILIDLTKDELAKMAALHPPAPQHPRQKRSFWAFFGLASNQDLLSNSNRISLVTEHERILEKQNSDQTILLNSLQQSIATAIAEEDSAIAVNRQQIAALCHSIAINSRFLYVSDTLSRLRDLTATIESGQLTGVFKPTSPSTTVDLIDYTSYNDIIILNGIAVQHAQALLNITALDGCCVLQLDRLYTRVPCKSRITIKLYQQFVLNYTSCPPASYPIPLHATPCPGQCRTVAGLPDIPINCRCADGTAIGTPVTILQDLTASLPETEELQEASATPPPFHHVRFNPPLFPTSHLDSTPAAVTSTCSSEFMLLYIVTSVLAVLTAALTAERITAYILLCRECYRSRAETNSTESK